MLLTQWLVSLKTRLATRSRQLHARRRSRPTGIPAAAECLERRVLLAAPVAVDDFYEKIYQNTHSPSNNFHEVAMNNDFDPDGDFSGAELVSGPSLGTLEDFTDGGGFSYIPPAQWVGTDTFTYRLYEVGTGVYGNTATVTLKLTNRPPEPKDDTFVLKPGETTVYGNVKPDNGNGADSDPDGVYQPIGSMEFFLVSGPQHGTVQLHQDTGDFTYTAGASFAGEDTFQYEMFDGLERTTAAVTIKTASADPAKADSDDGDFSDEDCGPLSYQSESNPHPILHVDIDVASHLSAPAWYDATLVVGGNTVVSDQRFDAAGMAGKTVRMALQFDASSYATGYYDYTLTLVARNSSGGALFTHAVSDQVAVANRTDSEYGNRWWLPFLDRLDVDAATTSGVGLIRSDGTADFFDYDGLSYASPAGVFETLTRTTDGSGNTTGYLLNSPDGWTKHFSTAGLLTKVADRNGREETFNYTDADGDGLVDELAGRTDFHGYTETFTYSSGRLSSWSDGRGLTYTFDYHADGTLAAIIGPPAVPGGPMPTISYTYDPTTKLLLTKTDIKGEVTTVTYGSDLRVRSIDRPETAVESVTPSQIAGLDGLVLPADVVSVKQIDGKSWTRVIDSLGNATEQTDANGNVTEYVRNANGLVREIRTVDPNSPTGPQRVTKYEYNSRGRATKITHPDATWVEYGYAANGLDLLSFRDERGKLWTWTVDAAGNRLTETDPLGNVTTWTYDGRGNVLGVTLPDPDGGGPLAAPVTQYEYDARDRVTKVKWTPIAGPLSNRNKLHSTPSQGSCEPRSSRRRLGLPIPGRGDGETNGAAPVC